MKLRNFLANECLRQAMAMRLTLTKLLAAYSVLSFIGFMILLSWCSSDSQRSQMLLAKLPDKVALRYIERDIHTT